MPAKVIDVPPIGAVHFYKRRGSRSIRVTITPPRVIRVTLPYWVPYASGVAFVRSKADWIQTQLTQQPTSLLEPDRQIGKLHRLLFQPDRDRSEVQARVNETQIIVSFPADMTWRDEAVQAKASAAAIRALRKQAERALPARLRDLAAEHGYSYSSVSIKQLKRRWGSCDHNHDIVLNLFLMQLPWDLIDYVLLHELTHTHHLNHSAEFWDEMHGLLPDLAARRKAIKQHQPQF